ncbi:MAG: hypothetical protein ACLFST_02850 [Spirochaetia bacterium]
MSSTQKLTRQPRTAKSENTGKIYCANCIHCKVITEGSEDRNCYYLRVRCDAGKWRKKLGEEKIYKYFTVARRSIDSCDMYEPMGDIKNFIKDLKKTLPITDEEYMI